MNQSFFPQTWRSKEVEFSEEEKQLSLGEFNLLRIKRKLIGVITTLIKDVFSYDKIEVAFEAKENRGSNASGYSSGRLEPENGHLKYHFAAKLFNNQFYEFSVRNIPAMAESRHIQIFFTVIMKYLLYFYESVQKDLPIVNERLIASPNFVVKTDIWLYNIERTIIVEYLYTLFNTVNEDYPNIQEGVSSPISYDLDLINKILDFAYELNTRKVENKEIYCGFIFHKDIDEIQNNSVRSLEFDEKFEFGDFGKLKNHLEISNGQNVFFNVTDEKVTHLLITREALNEINLNPLSSGKTFQSKPMILSIQGNGKIYILEGRSDNNRVILQISNSKPIIRDNNFIHQFIINCLKSFSNVSFNRIDIFAKWIMSLSQKKHGTSLLFNQIVAEEKLVKTFKISLNDDLLFDNQLLEHDLGLLNNLVNPDGAVIFNNQLIPTHISTILPIDQSATGTSGGARHNSISNFTKEFNCLGIVISEDGPITIFKQGEKLIKF